MDSQLEGFLNSLGKAEGHRVNIGALDESLKQGVV